MSTDVRVWIVLLVALLAGCSERVTPEAFAIATKSCEPHEGLKFLEVYESTKYYMVICKNETRITGRYK